MKKRKEQKSHRRKKRHNNKNHTTLVTLSILALLALSYYLLHFNDIIGKAASQLPAIQADRLMEADYIIGENDSVSLINLRAFNGPLRGEEMIAGDYQFNIFGRNNQLITQEYFPAYFVIFDPFYRVKEIPVTITVPYREEYATMDLVHEDKLIYRHDISTLCAQDKICQRPENAISCPADCPTGSADNYCDRVPDNKCDPDCLGGDGDCSPGSNAWIITSIGVMVLLAVVTFFLKKRRMMYKRY